jgi:MoaA/NifB/PqqE/SkfB family radical SAM enzyme
VSLETLALCNAACTFCPYPTLERQGTRLSDDLIHRLIDEMAEWKLQFYFSPFKVNEPLLDSRLIPICREVNNLVPLARIRIFSNGQALTPAKIEGIAELDNVEHLWISLNSHIKEEYEALMALDFDKTVKRLDHLHSLDFPHAVVLSAVGFPNEPFRRYCFDRWPKFQSLAIKRDAWIDYTNPQRDEVPDEPCWRWFELSITATGVVSMCCMDGTAKYAIGDVNKQTMLEIYNAPLWRERREKMLSRKQVGDPCSRCTY